MVRSSVDFIGTFQKDGRKEVNILRLFFASGEVGSCWSRGINLATVEPLLLHLDVRLPNKVAC